VGTDVEKSATDAAARNVFGSPAPLHWKAKQDHDNVDAKWTCRSAIMNFWGAKGVLGVPV
jgi:hypothetical protein